MEKDDWNEDEPLLEEARSLPRSGFEPPMLTPGFREKVFRKTAASIQWRVRRRRALIAGAFLLVYAAGLGTARFIETREPSGNGPEPIAPSLPQEPARIQDMISKASPEEQGRALKRAGDRYLSEDLDVAGALSCYKELLRGEDGARGMAPEPGDSWLLVYLKNARQMEVSREKKDG